MATAKRTVKKHWNYERMLFLLFAGIMIVGLFAYLFTSGLLTGSQASKRPPCTKSKDQNGKCLLTCQTSTGNITVPCSAAVEKCKRTCETVADDDGSGTHKECERDCTQSGNAH